MASVTSTFIMTSSVIVEFNATTNTTIATPTSEYASESSFTLCYIPMCCFTVQPTLVTNGTVKDDNNEVIIILAIVIPLTIVIILIFVIIGLLWYVSKFDSNLANDIYNLGMYIVVRNEH